jgi:hypothetical protein
VNQKLIPVFGSVNRQGTNILLNWYGETGSVYRVQYKTNLNPAILWNDLSGDVLASGPTPVVVAGKTNSVVGAGPQRFYRVLALP